MEAFIFLKNSLISELIWDYPRKHRSYLLIVNASTGTGEIIIGGLGAMLCQTNEEGEERVIAFESRQLLIHEKNYTLFLVEMQVMAFAKDHFDNCLRGRKFIVFNDHKPLEMQSK
jgi:hypothetical protein